MADPQERTTDVPVLLVVPTGDRYLSPAVIDEAARLCSQLHRVEVGAKLWFPAAQPAEAATLIHEHVSRTGSA